MRLKNSFIISNIFFIKNIFYLITTFVVSILVAQSQAKEQNRIFTSTHFSLFTRSSQSINELLSSFEKSYDYLQKFGFAMPNKIRVVMYASTEEFINKSGGRYYNLAIACGGTIHLQPAYLLTRRSSNFSIEKTLTHELVHVAMHSQATKIPLWFHEGIALWVSEEETIATVKFETLKQLEKTLKQNNINNLRSAYSCCQKAVQRLAANYGKEKILKLYTNLNGQNSFEENFIQLTGKKTENWFSENLKHM